MDEARKLRTNMRALWMIIGIAVGIRLGLGMIKMFWFPDSVDYQALARAILQGTPYAAPNTIPAGWGGVNVASRMPGYPVFMAAVFAVSKGAIGAVLAAQAVMGGVIVWLTYVLAKRAGMAVGLLAAALAAVDPLSIGFSAAVLTETPFTLAMLTGLWLCVRLMEDPEGRRVWMRWAMLGAVWGIGVYFRASALWCIVPLALFVAAAGSGRRGVRIKQLAGAGVAVAVMFLSLSPWLVRNYRIFHSGPLRLTTLEGMSLYEAVYPGADGGPKQDKILWPDDFRAMNEAERNDEWARRAWKVIRDEPGRVAWLGVKKLGRTWAPWMNAEDFKGGAVQAASVLWHVPLFLLGLIGIFTGVRRASGGGARATSADDLAGGGRDESAARFSPIARWKGLLLIPVAYFSLVHSLFLGSVRYRVPLMPLVCVFAALGAWELFRRMSWGKPGAANGVLF